MNISKECLILNIRRGTWLGYKFDKMLTKKVTDEAGARADAARVNKHLIAKEALTAISTALGRVSVHFYDATLPWKDNGDRLLPRVNYVAFIAEHERLVGEFDNAVNEFLDGEGYATAQEQAEFRMVGMYNPNDYPTARELRHKFYIRLDIDAVSRAFDIRLNNNDQLIQDRVNGAIKALWERLAKPLEHFAEKMNEAGDEAKFRVATIDNLKEMLETVKTLNFTNDATLERIRSEIEDKLVVHDVKDLRKSDDLRASVGNEATRILETMRGFMNAMGGSEDEDETEDAA